MSERDQLDDLEVQLGRLLRAGVAMSTLALAAGLVATLASGAGRFSTNLLTLGVLLLIGTPVARVAISSVTYARRRDWTFTALTLVVLAELVASVIAAFRS